MENKRPKITDPEEYRLIKSIYFDKDLRQTEKLDELERLDRMESKQRNNNKSSR